MMKAVKLLVKIAVMMMAPGGVPAPPETRGREPHLFFFFLDLLPKWEKGFPSGPWLPWHGRGESPSEIGSISPSLSISAFSDSTLSPFLLYPEIRNSNWVETFALIFLRKLAFLRQKKSVNCLTGGSRGSGVHPRGGTTSCPPRTLVRVDFSSRFSKYSKKYLRLFLSRLDSV